MNIMKKIVGENKRSWDKKIKFSLLEDCTTTKTSTGNTPFELLYKIEAPLPVNIHIPTLQIAQQFGTDKEALQGRIDQRVELDETQRMAFDQMEKNQERVKGTIDRKARKKDLK
jgi:hypothetical protein